MAKGNVLIQTLLFIILGAIYVIAQSTPAPTTTTEVPATIENTPTDSDDIDDTPTPPIENATTTTEVPTTTTEIPTTTTEVPTTTTEVPTTTTEFPTITTKVPTTTTEVPATIENTPTDSDDIDDTPTPPIENATTTTEIPTTTTEIPTTTTEFPTITTKVPTTTTEVPATIENTPTDSDDIDDTPTPPIENATTTTEIPTTTTEIPTTTTEVPTTTTEFPTITTKVPTTTTEVPATIENTPTDSDDIADTPTPPIENATTVAPETIRTTTHYIPTWNSTTSSDFETTPFLNSTKPPPIDNPKPTPTPGIVTTSTIPPDEVIEKVEDEIGNILNNTQNANITQEDWTDSLESVNNAISDIVTNDHVIANISREKAENLTTSSLEVLNGLIEKPLVWSNLTNEQRLNSTSNIFKLVQDLSFLMNSKQESNQPSFDRNFTSIAFQSKTFEVEANGSMEFAFDNIQLQLPLKALSISANSGVIPSTAVVVKNFTNYLSSEEILVNSDAISLVVKNHTQTNLANGHKFVYITKNQQHLQFRDKAECVYWDFNTTSWSTDGCSPISSQCNKSYTVCECDHLTNFAALMDIANREGPSLAKSILTFICSGLTCIFLLLAAYGSLKWNKESYTRYDYVFKVKSNKFMLNQSIYFWLFVSHVLIMGGMDLTENDIICIIASLALLFSLLTTFSFMLMLCVHLYISLSEKFLFRFSRFGRFVMIGYAIPIVIILGSMILIYFFEEEQNVASVLYSFKGEYFCWISSSTHPFHIWIFAGPATLIIVANLYILGSMLVKALQLRKLKSRHLPVIISTILLTFNFGIPWIMYIFYIYEYFANFSYVFILVNGTQGIVLFGQQYYMYRVNLRRRAFAMESLSSYTRSTASED